MCAQKSRVVGWLLIVFLVIGVFFISQTSTLAKEAASPEKIPISLSFNDTVFAPSHLLCKVTKWFTDEVNTKTNGRVKFTHYYSSSLTRGGAGLDALGKGISDFALLVTGYYPSKLYLWTVFDGAPFGPSDHVLMYEIGVKLQKESSKEFRDMLDKLNTTWLTVMVSGPATLESSKPIRTLEDMKGKKIAITGEWGSKIVQGWGAVPLGMPLPDRVTAAQTGMIDGSILGYDASYPLRMYDYFKYATEIGLGTKFGGLILMNSDSLNKLPKDIQSIIIETASQAGLKFAEMNRSQIAGIIKEITSKYGVDYYKLPWKEEVRWANALPDLAAEWIKIGESKGLPAKKVMKAYIRICEQAGHKFPRNWAASY
jgi:TRAP-type C4-dicarboxylate transport system substrate-binding protein